MSSNQNMTLADGHRAHLSSLDTIRFSWSLIRLILILAGTSQDLPDMCRRRWRKKLFQITINKLRGIIQLCHCSPTIIFPGELNAGMYKKLARFDALPQSTQKPRNRILSSLGRGTCGLQGPTKSLIFPGILVFYEVSNTWERKKFCHADLKETELNH